MAIAWIGLADHWQTVGPVPGLGPDTPVATPSGPRPVAALRPGDLVRTADAGDLAVLWQGRIQAPEAGSFRSVRLRAPYFGLGRDIVLRAVQQVAVGGADVEYLFGEEEVLVEARHLVNGQTAIWDAAAGVTTSHAIVLDRPALISAGGLRVEALYLGGLAQSPGLARTTAPGALAEAGRLPLHGARVRRALKPFEALALARAREAGRSPIAA